MKIMTNQTASPLEVHRKDGTHLTIPPLGEMRINEAAFDEEFVRQALEPLENAYKLRVEDQHRLTPLMIAVGLDFWWLLIGVLLGLIIEKFRGSALYWIIFSVVLVGLPVIGGILSRDSKQKPPMGPIINQYLSLSAVLIIGLGLPAAIIYFFGGGTALLAPGTQEFFSLELLARISQLMLITIASLLPALLFFLFDRQLTSTLRSEFYHQVMLLDPALQTLKDVKARYQNRVEEIYGSEDEYGGRLLNDTRLPILVGTLLITTGWILSLPVIGPLPGINSSFDIHKILLPIPSPTSYAFLGAYFFGLNMVFRRYVRSDLRPKAYSHITVRILTTLVLVWFLVAVTPQSNKQEVLESNRLLMCFAFFIGILPETWLVFFREYVKIGGGIIRRIAKGVSGLEEEQPLTDLEGINLYHRARLMEEGVENIENLANNDLVDLILRTRIPVPVLIDWVDQAILYLHTRSSGADGDTPYKILRGYGIRTATDLQRAFIKAGERDEGRSQRGETATEEAAFLDIIPNPAGGSRPVRVILDALEDDEWLKSIVYWRKQNAIDEADKPI